MAEKQSSFSMPLHRSHSMESLQFSPNFEGYIFFDPMNFSQCMPAKSDKVEFIDKSKGRIPQRKSRVPKNKTVISSTLLATKILRGKTNEEKRSEQGKESVAKSRTPQGDGLLKSKTAEKTDRLAERDGSEKIFPAESDTEKTEARPKLVVPKESLQENPDKVENVTAGLCLGCEKTSVSEAKSNTDVNLNAVNETENVEQANNAPSEDSKIENACDRVNDLPPLEWNDIDESSLKAVVRIQEARLEREKRTVESLKTKYGSCHEENFQLKNEILALQTAMTEREYVIEQMKMVINDFHRERDDMMSELSINRLRIEHKVGCLASEIRKLEKREVLTRGLLKEATAGHEDKQAFENAMKVVERSADLTEHLESLKETLSNKENVIACLKNNLVDAMKRSSHGGEPETGGDKALKEKNESLKNALKQTKEERDGVYEEYRSSVDEWENIRQHMEQQHQELCDTLRRVEKENEVLDGELSSAKKDLEQKSGDLEKYEGLMSRRESEVFESKKVLNNYKLETQRSLCEMEDEMQVIRKQNDESYDLLGIATSDLKILRKRNKELEEACSEKDLQREGSARALNELTLSDENLKIANSDLEAKYSEILSEVGELTQRCDKLARVNAEREVDNLSEKNEALTLDNHRLFNELELGVAKLNDYSKILEESQGEKAELEEIAQNLREEKRALSVEVEELKINLQLTQQGNRAEQLVEGAESHEDMLKSEVEKLNEELGKRDWELLNRKKDEEARDLKKGKEMARNYEAMNSELQMIILELEDCKAEGLKDAHSHDKEIQMLEAEKSKLAYQLRDGKKTVENLKAMIKELQDDLLEQEERFRENSILIFQETEDAKKRIMNVEQRFNEQLSAKDTEIANLQDIGINLGEKVREFQDSDCDLQRRVRSLSEDNELMKRKNKALDKKVDKAKKLEKYLSKKLEEVRSAESGVGEVEKTLNKVIENMTRDLEQAKKENSIFKNQVETQRHHTQKKEGKYNGMKETIDSLKIFSAEQAEKCNELLKDLAFEKEKHTSLKEKADTYYQKMNELHDQLVSGERRCSDFKRRYDASDKVCHDLQRKLETLQMKCESLTKEIGDKESLQEKVRSELLKLRVEYDHCQHQLEEKESEKNSIQNQLNNFVVNQNSELRMEVRKSHSNVMEALHESKMGEMRNELIEMKRKGALRREMAMTSMESESCTSIRSS